jgi:predicted MFS family arabinose efflux permease
MPSSSVMSMTDNIQTMGSRMDMALGASGLGFFVGSPIGGALLESNGGWASLQAWAGSLLIQSGFCSLVARIMRVGTKFKVKI